MSLDAYKIQIDKIDNQLLELLERRRLITKMVIKIKKKKGMDIEDADGKKDILERLVHKSRKIKRDELEQLYTYIFDLSSK